MSNVASGNRTRNVDHPAGNFAASHLGISDHRAFSYFKSEEILALPVFSEQHQISFHGLNEADSDIVLLQVDQSADDPLQQIAKMDFDRATPQRTFLINGAIFGISTGEIQARLVSDLSAPIDQINIDAPVTLRNGVDTEVPVESVDIASVTQGETRNSMDVNGDGKVTVLHPLNVINRLIDQGEGTLANDFDEAQYLTRPSI